MCFGESVNVLKYDTDKSDCDMFLSSVWTNSDGTHSLQMIHWWAGDVMLHFSKSVSTMKQTQLHIEWSIPLSSLGQTYQDCNDESVSELCWFKQW